MRGWPDGVDPNKHSTTSNNDYRVNDDDNDSDKDEFKKKKKAKHELADQEVRGMESLAVFIADKEGGDK